MKTGQQHPTVGSLDDLVATGDQNAIPVKSFIGHNLGNRTFLVTLPMHEFYRMSDVANERGKNGEPVTQRKLDPAHAKKLALYILRGLVSAAIARRERQGQEVSKDFTRIQEKVGRQEYLSLQPIVVNIRNCERGGGNLPATKLLVAGSDEVAAFKVYLSQQDVLWVVDGQHRRKAMDLVFDFLSAVRTSQTYAKGNQSLYPAGDYREVPPGELQVWQECFEVARSVCTVVIEAHLGLDHLQERQLFHDLNNLAKRVDRNLALAFDTANPINRFIKEELVESELLCVSEKDSKEWADHDGSISRKDLVAVNAHLFLNKSNISGASPADVEPRIHTAKAFWSAVAQIPDFGEEGAKTRSVAAQPVMLKALAKLTYDFAFGRHANPSLLKQLLDGLTDIDYSHSNPMWRYYELTEPERMQHGLVDLAEYLPKSDDSSNRDIGSFQGEYMRFGSKHNDIFPILGDMIRWQLKLPNRHANADEQ